MDNMLHNRFQTLMLRFHQLDGEFPPLGKFGITPAQVVYLDYLRKHPHCRLNDLADALQFKPASASAMVSALEMKGLVQKAQEQEDGRALSLNLTAQGYLMVSEIEEFRNKRVSMILNKLEATEKETLLQLLEKILLKEEEG